MSGFDAYHKWLGIPSEARPASYYRLLGVEPFEADPDVISAAADRQAAYLRAFSAGPYSDHAERLLAEVARARLCLLDPVRRAEYDAALRAGMTAGARQTAPVFVIPAVPPTVAAHRQETPPEESREFEFDEEGPPRPTHGRFPVAAGLFGLAALAASLGVAVLFGLPSEPAKVVAEEADDSIPAAWAVPDAPPELPAASPRRPKDTRPAEPRPPVEEVRPDPAPEPRPEPPAEPPPPEPEPPADPSPAEEEPQPSAADPEAKGPAPAVRPELPQRGVQSFGGHSYKFFAEPTSWTQAVRRCEDMGGTLAVIDRPGELEFLTKLLSRYRGPVAWLGATDQAYEGRWAWVNGQPVAGFKNHTRNLPAGIPNRSEYDFLALAVVNGMPILRDLPAVPDPMPGFLCEWPFRPDQAGKPVE